MPASRHQLRRLTAAAWGEVLSRPWDDEARACLALWAERDLPLVVTRQPAGLSPHRLAMGLPAPASFGRRRIAVAVDPRQTLAHGGFPRLAAIGPLLDAGSRPDWQRLADALARLGCDARVYGSHGWQALTRFDHLHAGSDIDLLLPVANAAQADAVCALLAEARAVGPRLDGELVFPGDAAIAWREWSARPALGMLVKRADGARIEAAAPC